MTPSLGVLITYYNEGSLLTECLDTLLSGPDKPDEILIYDDASQDPAKNYVKPRHGARIIRGTKNIGIGLARNELMKASQSGYIHFQDADDCFDPAWCGRIREAIGPSGQIDIVFNNFLGVDLQSGAVWSRKGFPMDKLRPEEDLIRFFFSEGQFILVAMVTFRRELGLKVGGYLPREILSVSEDLEFHMRLFALGLKYRTVDQSLVIKRKRPGSLSRDEKLEYRYEIRLSRFKVCQLVHQWLPTRYHASMAKYLLAIMLPLFKNHEINEAKVCYEFVNRLSLEGHVNDIADLYHLNAAEFLKIGDEERAKDAFRRSRQYGPPVFKKYSPLYRSLAKTFGGESVERIASIYRCVRDNAASRKNHKSLNGK